MHFFFLNLEHPLKKKKLHKEVWSKNNIYVKIEYKKKCSNNLKGKKGERSTAKETEETSGNTN